MSTCGEGSTEARRKCVKEATKERDECVAERDEGYNNCAQSREDRYKRCCDWAPCSWFCRAFWWVVNVVCVAWEWVSNVVCVVLVTIKEVVCVAWFVLPALLCQLVDVLTSLVGLLASLAEALLNWALSAVAFVWGIITSIPGLGPLLTWLAGFGNAGWNFVISLPDFVLTLLGIMPEKKLRLGIISLRDGEGRPIVPDETVLLRAVQCAINIFSEQVNTRVIPIRYAQYHSAFEDREVATSDYIFEGRPVSSRLLDLCCEACMNGKALGTVGADLNQEMVSTSFWGGGRRLIGYGAPIIAFTTRSFEGGAVGCSLGVRTDWVTVEFQDSETALTAAQLTSTVMLGRVSTLAHEIGHACTLFWHGSSSNRLMTPLKSTPAGTRTCRLTRWEKAVFRSSRHVTYL